MHYPCAKFGDLGLSRCGFIVRTDTQTDRHIDTQIDRVTEADYCYTDMTTVSVSNYQTLADNDFVETLSWPLSTLEMSI